MEIIPQIIHKSWHEHLQPLFDDPKMILLKDKILPTCDFYPNGGDIFKVFSMPLQDIKVVALGQDPYPNGEAIGLAFAVKETKNIPASLKIIGGEIYNEDHTALHHPDITPLNPKWKTLQHWVDQGVFLLNSGLTVERRNSGSHIGIWHWFTRQIVGIISKEVTPIWLLWGAKAQTLKGYISNAKIEYSNITSIPAHTRNVNVILEAPHPAAETYSGSTGKKFTGCNHFNKCNEILKSKGRPPIYW